MIRIDELLTADRSIFFNLKYRDWRNNLKVGDLVVLTALTSKPGKDIFWKDKEFEHLLILINNISNCGCSAGCSVKKSYGCPGYISFNAIKSKETFGRKCTAYQTSLLQPPELVFPNNKTLIFRYR